MSHTLVSAYYHIIFSTKYRLPLILPDMEEGLYACFGGIISRSGAVLEAAGGAEDHPHLLVSGPTSIRIADLVRKVKANSTRWVQQTFPDRAEFRWQTGYSMFTVGYRQLPNVKRYLAIQKQHHRSESYITELRRMLDAHDIDYDPREQF